MHTSAALLLALVFVLTTTVAGAQGVRSPGHSPAPPTATARPSVYLSCPVDCYDAYLRQELSYFNFSRDPYRANITLVVVRQPAGNGGERFTASLVPATPTPPEVTPPAVKPRSFNVPADTSDHTKRQLLLQVLLRLLQEHLQGTQHAAAFELVLPPRNGDELSTLDDPWDYWVFMPQLSGMGEGGSGYYSAEAAGTMTVRRITEPSKLRLRGTYSRRLSSYRLEDQSRIHGDVYGWDARALYAHSLGKRWALGGLAAGRINEFENLRSHLHLGPLAEFNVFPYSDNASRQIRFAYQAGVWANRYFEETEARRLRELKPYHALSLIVDFAQPWGSVQWVGQANQFLDEPSQHRLSSGAVLNIRLFEGMAFGLEGQGAWVGDMINLRRRPVTDNELLLWTVQQPTDYTFEFAFTLTYAFGSTHNTIVNPRFARVDLDEE